MAKSKKEQPVKEIETISELITEETINQFPKVQHSKYYNKDGIQYVGSQRLKRYLVKNPVLQVMVLDQDDFTKIYLLSVKTGLTPDEYLRKLISNHVTNEKILLIK